MADFSRDKGGKRLRFLGVKTNAVADSMSDGKCPYAQNVRSYKDDSLQSRPQWTQLFAAPASPGPVLTHEPALGVYKVGGALIAAGTSFDTGYTANFGCSMIPFRPNASPSSWEYVFDNTKSSKILSPASSPTIHKIGIVEPQTPCDANVSSQFTNLFNTGGGAGSFTNGGTATAAANGARVADTVIAAISDPSIAGLWSVLVHQASSYQRGMQVSIAAQAFNVLDVFPPTPTAINIAAILYFSGATGHCIIVPENMNTGPGDPGLSYTLPSLLASVRRGSILQVGAEAVIVWSTTVGPDGTVCIETSTSIHHTIADQILGLPAIQVEGGSPAPGNAITSPDITWTNNTGIGTQDIAITPPFFVFSNFSFQDDDYMHVSLNVANANSITKIRLLFDVNDGLFDKDYYYYEVRPSDLQTLFDPSNPALQLGLVQLIQQRADVDNHGIVSAADNALLAASGAQLQPDINKQWTEIFFKVRDLTRIGNDQTKTISNLVEFRIEVTSTLGVAMAFNSLTVFGGFQLDVGDQPPLQYRYRARDSQTGAASNFSPVMRYGISPRRSQVTVILPGSYPDAQADTFDIERQGANLEDWTFVGSQLIGSGNFIDTFGDDAVINNDHLPEDNYEPFPTVGPPLSTTSNGCTVTGYLAALTFSLSPTNPSLTAFASLLPGNFIQIGQQVYTTYARPVFVSSGGGLSNWKVQLVENAGSQVSVQATIYEPFLANRLLSEVWGPDDNGCLFAVGDVLRPGVVQHTNPQNPDGVGDGNDDELCSPTEVLFNGALIQQTSCVASSDRWWAGRAGKDQQGNLKYNWSEIPVGRGLAAVFGICTDGDNIYFVAKDGIWMHSGGQGESLTDADLFDLFPHEGLFPGIQPQNVTYNGNTIFAPDYRFVSHFRLSTANGWLYFNYFDSGQNFRTLVLNLRTRAWCPDILNIGGASTCIHASTISNTTIADGSVTQQVYSADTTGAIYVQNNSPAAGVGESVVCVLATWEDQCGDIRAQKMFGDAAVDVFPASAVTVTPIFLGVAFGTSTTIAAGANRVAGAEVNLLGENLSHSMGLQFSWTDQGRTTQLFSWQPSWVPQPEDTTGRFTDWDGKERMFYQGFKLEADTGNVLKAIKIRDADTLTLHDFNSLTGTNQVQHNGQVRKTYSFVTPFQAHLVRIEPQDQVAWRLFGVEWIGQPTPSGALNWYTQPTSHELPGYQHAHHMVYAYACSQTVTLTVAVDGVANTYTLPSTGGAYKKLIVMLQPVKGLVFQYSAVSTGELQVWNEDIEIYVKAWGDPAPYTRWKKFGTLMGAEVTV